MKNIAKLIEWHGGLHRLKAEHIAIDPPSDGFMRLVIEHVGRGPRGNSLVSVAHYYSQNGDAMRDPEMEFEVLVLPGGENAPKTWRWLPVAFQQDGVLQSRMVGVQLDLNAGKAEVRVIPSVVRDCEAFARIWDRNIRAQGYLNAYKRQYFGTLGTNMTKIRTAVEDVSDIPDTD